MNRGGWFHILLRSHGNEKPIVSKNSDIRMMFGQRSLTVAFSVLY